MDNIEQFEQHEQDRWYISVGEQLVIMYLHKEELGMEEGKRMSVRQTMQVVYASAAELYIWWQASLWRVQIRSYPQANLTEVWTPNTKT